MKEPKRIFILGAGSSIGNSNGSYPSADSFLNKATECNLLGGSGYSQLKEFGAQIFGKEITQAQPRINIEDLFTHIEIEFERNKSFKLANLRQQLLSLIKDLFIILDQNLINIEGEYNALNNHLIKSDSILTFNWDLSLDNELGRSLILKKKYANKNIKGDELKATQYYEFINELSALSEQTWKKIAVESPYTEWNTERGYYLKMHGSIDWHYCTNESCRAFRKVFPVLDSSETVFCSDCHETLELLIIPPILNKGYRRYPLIRKIWNLASKEVSTANEIIIWGYSLPPTDFYSMWLLRQARCPSLQKIIIINPSVVTKKKDKIRKPFVLHFTRIFEGCKVKHKIYESFSDYVDDKDVRIKYDLSKL